MSTMFRFVPTLSLSREQNIGCENFEIQITFNLHSVQHHRMKRKGNRLRILERYYNKGLGQISFSIGHVTRQRSVLSIIHKVNIFARKLLLVGILLRFFHISLILLSPRKMSPKTFSRIKFWSCSRFSCQFKI